MDKNTIARLTNSFDAIVQLVPDESVEFWYARELMEQLGYTDLFLHWLNSQEAKQRIKLSTQGSVRETVSFDNFCAIGFPKIDINEQKALAEYFSLLSAEIDTLKALFEKYKIQKRGLMQKMLTGEWRVRGFATNDEG